MRPLIHRLAAVGLTTLLVSCSSSVPAAPLLQVSGDTQLELSAASYCSGVPAVTCVDGDRGPLRQVSWSEQNPLSLEVNESWTFDVLVSEESDTCGREIRLPSASGAAMDWIPQAGTYLVDVFGRSPIEGDASWRFIVVSEERGAAPPLALQVFWNPLSSVSDLSVVVYNDISDSVESVSLGVDDSHHALVRSDPDGTSVSGCQPIDVGFVASIEPVGEPPFDVVVEVTTESGRLLTTALTWPSDFVSGSNQSLLQLVAPAS